MSVSITAVLRLMLMLTVTVLATAVLGPPLIIVGLFTSSGIPGYIVGWTWSWCIARSMGLTFSLHGAENAVPGQSYILTPNHQGNADILALYATLPMRFRWVLKKELLRIPVFGGALAATGAISLDRTDREQSIRSLQEGVKKLSGGWSVLIYPEGTRTPDGNLLPFKKGAFMMAVQTGLPILPITSNGAFRVLPRKTLLFRPGHITVTIGEPIVTTGLTEADVPALMEKTKNAVAANLNLDYDPFAKPFKEQ